MPSELRRNRITDDLVMSTGALESEDSFSNPPSPTQRRAPLYKTASYHSMTESTPLLQDTNGHTRRSQIRLQVSSLLEAFMMHANPVPGDPRSGEQQRQASNPQQKSQQSRYAIPSIYMHKSISCFHQWPYIQNTHYPPGSLRSGRHHSRAASWSQRLVNALTHDRYAFKEDMRGSKDSISNDERVWYDQFTSTDWIHDSIADAYRVKALRSRKDIRGRIIAFFDGTQGWILSALVGFVTAVVAYMVDVSEAPFFDWKDGYCQTGFHLSEKVCGALFPRFPSDEPQPAGSFLLMRNRHSNPFCSFGKVHHPGDHTRCLHGHQRVIYSVP